jgi:tRNA threonylcarbamoyladenosine biosynthesis protein TsaE
MATIISNSPEDTLALGETWGREARRGWVFGLTGELGAGKTQLVKGLARGLGIAERVHSPTFTLVNEYSGGRLPLFHLDLYRLETAQQAIQAGLEEFLGDPPGVTVVEWAERWFDDTAHPRPTRVGPCRRVWLETLTDRTRRIAYEDLGA